MQSAYLNIINIVWTGETPTVIKAAYEKLPKIPAPPVPFRREKEINKQKC